MLRNNETDQAKWTELLCINNQRKQMTKEQFLIAEETIFQDQLHKDNVIVVWEISTWHNRIDFISYFRKI